MSFLGVAGSRGGGLIMRMREALVWLEGKMGGKCSKDADKLASASESDADRTALEYDFCFGGPRGCLRVEELVAEEFVEAESPDQEPKPSALARGGRAGAAEEAFEGALAVAPGGGSLGP